MNTSFRREFAQKIKQERVSRKISQQAVAEYLHIDRSTYAYYEQGKSAPPLEMLIDIARLFHVSADYLLGLCDKPIL